MDPYQLKKEHRDAAIDNNYSVITKAMSEAYANVFLLRVPEFKTNWVRTYMENCLPLLKRASRFVFYDRMIGPLKDKDEKWPEAKYQTMVCVQGRSIEFREDIVNFIRYLDALHEHFRKIPQELLRRILEQHICRWVDDYHENPNAQGPIYFDGGSEANVVCGSIIGSITLDGICDDDISEQYQESLLDSFCATTQAEWIGIRSHACWCG